MQLGMIGLGRMGANMVRRLIRQGHNCVVFDRSPQTVSALAKLGQRVCCCWTCCGRSMLDLSPTSCTHIRTQAASGCVPEGDQLLPIPSSFVFGPKTTVKNEPIPGSMNRRGKQGAGIAGLRVPTLPSSSGLIDFVVDRVPFVENARQRY